jgi:hypothetical protein
MKSFFISSSQLSVISNQGKAEIEKAESRNTHSRIKSGGMQKLRKQVNEKQKLGKQKAEIFRAEPEAGESRH